MTQPQIDLNSLLAMLAAQQTTPPGVVQNAPAMPPGFPAPTPPPAPTPVVTGSLDDFFGQPSVSGGPSWSFKDMPIGTSYTGTVERAIVQGDITQQTQPGGGGLLTFPDGSPKWVMKVPMSVTPDEKYTDGKASWFCSGQARDQLIEAMTRSGAPAGPPEVGARITVTLTERRRTGKGFPWSIYKVDYARPAAHQAAPVSAVDAPAPVPAVDAPAPAGAPALDEAQKAVLRSMGIAVP